MEVARAPLLDAGGAAIALGFVSAAQGLATPVVPSACSLFAPRGACLAADGSLWVADTGHHRLLGWSATPTDDHQPATILIGQLSFSHEGGRNGGNSAGPATLNVPTGVAACGAGLVLADSWNHRVLLWRERPEKSQQPPDLILGQADGRGVESNRGQDRPGADTLFWPFGVAFDGTRLWVADTGNRRILMWERLPSRSGQPADLVLGQRDFSCRDENGGGAPTEASMCWPHGLAFLGERLCVADAGNNRVMVWNRSPTTHAAPADVIIGQRRANAVDHNQGDYWPGPASLNMPYSLTTIADFLVVADTANSRLMAWQGSDIANGGVTASRLTGQHDWTDKGENRWQATTRDSLCWPYGVAATAQFAIVADAGNNRVLLWPWDRAVRP